MSIFWDNTAFGSFLWAGFLALVLLSDRGMVMQWTKWSPVVVLCLLASASWGQNLVPNGSFEQVEQVDTITAKAGFTFECKILEDKPDDVKVKVAGADDPIPWKKKDIAKFGKKTVPAGWPWKGWNFHEIVLPVTYEVDQGTARDGKNSLKFACKKGKGFMHSAAFPVKAKRQYTIAAWIKGKGKVSLELLWWAKYGDDEIAMCKHHRDIVVKPTQASGGWQRIMGRVTSPEDATKAYVRIVGEEDDVWIDNVVME